jgi:hypothetical protein
VSLNCPTKEVQAIFYCKDTTVIYDAIRDWTVTCNKYDRENLQNPEIACASFDEKNNLAHAVQYFHDLIEGKAESNVDRAIAVTSIIEKIEKGKE